MSLAFDDPLLGKTIAQRYRLISRLGAGGMAAVYLARHVLIDRLSAIKLLNTELGHEPAFRDRFLREARAVNRINHPNIVEITDYGEAEGFVYLVMEYVPGEALAKALERGPLGWRRAVGIGLQLASALGRAHQMGVIHRDIKPSNVLLVARKDGDQAKLTDFGVAKMMDATTLTTTSIALGTPGYVAPEYRAFGRVDPRSDLFSLGVVLYQTSAGAMPFDPSVQATAASGALPPMRRLVDRVPEVPRFFDEIVMTFLAPDPDDRPRDGYEAFDLLRRIAEHEGIVLPGEPREARQPREPLEEAILSELTVENAGDEPRRRPGPHLTTTPADRIAPLCASALSRVTGAAHAAGAVNGAGRDVIAEATKLVHNVDAIARMVAADTVTREAAAGRARALRTELGQRLDDVAREHSKTLGWAGTVVERNYAVQAARTSGEHPVNAQEAMVWELAQLETEEDRARERAAGLARRMAELEAELNCGNERLEHEMLVVTARLEGRIAALRCIALEAAMTLDQAGAALGLTPGAVWTGPSARG